MTHIHFEHGQDTIIAVTLGAILATAGGFIAGQVESHLRRRERERTAALLFGEILAALVVLTDAMREAHGIGEPFGPVTMRIVRAANRETETYDRNREELSAIRDPELRARLHSVFVRLRMALESIVETEESLHLIGRAGATEGRGEVLLNDRELSYGYTLEVATEVEPLLKQLQRITETRLDIHLTAIRAATPLPPRAARDPVLGAAEQR